MPDLFHADVETLAALNDELPTAMHPTHREMAEEMYLHLIEDAEALAHFGRARLAELVAGQVDRVAQKVGGCHFYMPKGISARLSPRDMEIVKAHRGNNGHLLARQHGISEMRVAQILKKYRMIEFARKQGSLDLDPAPFTPSR